MAKRKAKRYPGSIYVPKGRKQLRVKVKNPDYKPRDPSSKRYVVIASGLPDTPQGWKYAEEMLEKFWLQQKGFLEAPAPKKKEAPQYYTFQEMLDAYKEVRKSKLQPGSLSTYELSFNAVITDREVNCTKANLKRFINTHVSTFKGKPSTVNNRLRSLKTIAKWAYRNNYIDELLTDEEIADYYIRVGERENKYFTEDECTRLFNHFWKLKWADHKEFALMLKVMWLTGARIGDVLTLTWEQVDLKTREITWKNKITKLPELVPVSEKVIDILLLLKDKGYPDNKVFKWDYQHRDTLRERLIRGLMKLQIERDGRSFHSFRKTFCNKVFELNLPLPQSLALVRHKTVDVTIKHYLVRDNARLHEAVSRL